jgi:hypothetical protein
MVVAGAGLRAGGDAWTRPAIATGVDEPWHVGGGVLGLNVALAPLTLRRLSMRPPSAPPRLTDGTRQQFTTTVVLSDRRRFTDAAQRLVASLVSRGRSRIASAAHAADLAGVTADAGISPLRAALARWLAETNPAELPSFFSLTEQMRIGLGGRPLPDDLGGWGNTATLLTGRDECGSLPDLFWERYAGRRKEGLVAYAVPDLQLALALRLTELELPAVLVPDLLPLAMHDFLIGVPARHPDDWAAMIGWAAGLETATVERYLNLLTTNGPLRVDDPRMSELQ